MNNTFNYFRFQHWKTQSIILLIIGASLFSLYCDDPLSEEQKETLVRTLVQGPVQRGNYSIFWDGRNDADKRLSEGTYICNFYTQDYGHQVTMTALAGGSTNAAESNDSTEYSEVPLPLHYELDQNSPNPFYINEGTNILFSIPENSSIQITIHKQE